MTIRYIAGAAIGLVILATCNTLRKWKNPIGRDLEGMGVDENDRTLQEQEGPQGVWLMSYPNSGSEIIIDIIQKITGKATGTNYGDVLQNEKGFLTKEMYGSKPVWTNRVHGPWKFLDVELPSKYVPIVTHCAGTCTQCHPQYYMVKKFVFLEQCVTCIKYNPFNSGSKEKGHYDSKIIKKAGVVIRNPFDNVVAEFVQLRKDQDVMGDEVWLNNYPETPAGFHLWCQDVNHRFYDEEKAAWDEEIWELGHDIPCRQAFYRYIQWHERAHEITKFDMLDIPTRMVHTKDLQTNFEEYMSKLLAFYGLTAATPVSEFNGLDVDLPGYMHWYTKEERVRIACFMKRMATKTMSNRLRPYISECDQLQTPTVT
eukprot:CAMPEP_0172498700 /NCGR_PEP_ID=MMETSP1066-20121228/116126_1 /TAXON_ID=671091 /ORGANISM="Coscinodiscus wailesii, Strain CCMP2513" /LENGTH=369 /DNA_ID=CAMNT_0013272089 /DNA_START=93 /DNA_END=1202 /DNA_ORIENTATION=+